MIWKVAKRFLDPVTQQKIHVLSGNGAETLLQYIEAENLPVAYGGTCVCPGPHGCVAGLQLELLNETADGEDDAEVFADATEGDKEEMEDEDDEETFVDAPEE
eukprot:m.392281 g.392281  ORF g.392281 m.392281 type:complete len:103 (-) comp56348_c0_seq30:1495-1803(-)